MQDQDVTNFTLLDNDYILEMKNITKEFPGVKALDNVSFKLKEGTIHAICGENGAGKSTLIKILCGVHSSGSYTGDILINGAKVEFDSVRDAEGCGITCIHQELVLVPGLSVAENIFLGNQPNNKGVINRGVLNKLTDDLLVRVGINEKGEEKDIHPTDIVDDLSVGKQQLVEIAKALSKETRILILDEPTSALTEKETEVLLDILRNLRNEGVSCIYISHKLDEVMAISDEVTIIRDGNSIDSKLISDITKTEIIKHMVGRELTNQFPEATHQCGDLILEVKNYNVYRLGSKERKLLDDISFKINKGEVVGIAGLMGSGRTELFESLCGILPNRSDGEVYLNGKRLVIKSARDAIQNGIYYLTEDRNRYGLVLNMSVKENITLSSLKKISKLGVINDNHEEEYSHDYIERINIKTPNTKVAVETLSGGNRQKVSIAKSLMTNPQILILDEPTRGIDVGAKYEIYKIIHDLVDQGVAVIVISSELEEVLGLSDRVIVFRDGTIGGERQIKEADQVCIMNLATGQEVELIGE